MEELEFYNDMYRYAFDLAVFDAEHFETGFLSCNPQNGISNEKALELVGSSMYLLRNMAKQIRDAEADLNAYVNQLSFGMMFQYCFDKGVELMFHYVKGTTPIPTTFYVPDCMTNEGPDIPVQYQPGDDVIFKLGSIFHELKENCKKKYLERIGTEEYLFCFFRIAASLGFLYCLEMKL